MRKKESSRSFLITKDKGLYKNESSPYIRLGLALQKINDQDPKAMKFIELGCKKDIEVPSNLKLPKISLKNKR